ncbi:Polyol transporter 5 [Datura stramonium]|uniref:Polyol transporter 5 n=1 Tax=Datura stramonium TaxID=4076 RepID=A0ABS8RID4_DATST|nr:Polyol transporter 5 [Datura stramonium]
MSTLSLVPPPLAGPPTGLAAGTLWWWQPRSSRSSADRFCYNYAFLMVGRFVAGVGVGYALMVAPVYTAEVSPASSRGFLTSFPEVFINGGILLGYVSNVAFSKLPTHLSWRFMLGIGAIPSFLALVFWPCPVTALARDAGRLGDTRRVLNKTSDSLEEAQLRLADIKAAGMPGTATTTSSRYRNAPKVTTYGRN